MKKACSWAERRTTESKDRKMRLPRTRKEIRGEAARTASQQGF